MNEGIPVIIAFLLGFSLAQMIKCVVGMAKAGDFSWQRMKATVMASGGMPSGHTASLTAATVYVGLAQGVSVTFAVMCCVLAIVGYDAVNVRYAVGEQGKLLNKLLRRRRKVVEGHTVPQVLVGLALGVLIGVGVYGLWGVLNGWF